MTNTIKYKVYLNSTSNLIYKGTNLQYFQHETTSPYIYYITWINDLGEKSTPIVIQIP